MLTGAGAAPLRGSGINCGAGLDRVGDRGGGVNGR